jgi:large subunit ribosomal protein L15
MMLNSLSPASGSHKQKLRVGRGIGCTKGKTCGRGHKGQKARNGANRSGTFEGGQNPLWMRIPKQGFTSRVNKHAVSMGSHVLDKLTGDELSIMALKEQKLIDANIKKVKLYLTTEVKKKFKIIDVHMTASVKSMVDASVQADK